MPSIAWQSALLDPGTYPHPVRELTVVETHISIVALTGEVAYKLKKPVQFGFLDFSTPARRRFFCEEEVRLNCRTAPELYRGVVSLCRHGDGFRFGGAGEAVEAAVEMRQFPESDRFDRLAAGPGLSDAWIDELAGRVASLHAGAPAAAASGLDPHAARLERIFRQNSGNLPASPLSRGVDAAFGEGLGRHRALLLERQATHVRECHGDLHLGNVCLWQGQPLIFDCIEFSDDLRVIDVLSDAAFLHMDFLNAGKASAAHRFLSAYLEVTGDYSGLELLRLFVAYRAHVRAMVAHLTPPGDAGEGAALAERRDRYLRLAHQELGRPAGGITLMSGLPGSGKSTAALELAAAERGVRIRSDVERKRLHGREPQQDLYSAATTRRVYDVLLGHARAASSGGVLAVLDATYTRRDERRRVRELARSLQVPFRILHCTAPRDELERRVAARQSQGIDASDAGVAELRAVAESWEPFTPEELPFVEEAAGRVRRG